MRTDWPWKAPGGEGFSSVWRLLTKQALWTIDYAHVKQVEGGYIMEEE